MFPDRTRGQRSIAATAASAAARAARPASRPNLASRGMRRGWVTRNRSTGSGRGRPSASTRPITAGPTDWSPAMSLIARNAVHRTPASVQALAMAAVSMSTATAPAANVAGPVGVGVEVGVRAGHPEQPDGARSPRGVASNRSPELPSTTVAGTTSSPTAVAGANPPVMPLTTTWSTWEVASRRARGRQGAVGTDPDRRGRHPVDRPASERLADRGELVRHRRQEQHPSAHERRRHSRVGPVRWGHRYRSRPR